MSPVRHLIAVASLVALGLGFLAVTWGEEPVAPKGPPAASRSPINYPAGATDAEKREIDLRFYRVFDAEKQKTLLAAFPFESLEERLQFDVPGRKRLAKSLPAADLELDKWQPLLRSGQWDKIPPAAFAMLMTQERLGRDEHFERMQALAALHKLEVRKFVTNPGFGRARLDIMDMHRSHEKPPTDWSEADRGEEVKLPSKGDFFTANADPKGPTLPAKQALAGFHTAATHWFARPDTWGLVKDKTQVAGFLPHALEFVPDGHLRQRYDMANPTKDKNGMITAYPLAERWAHRRTELIGLLMHETPVVYINAENKLPTMAGIKDAKTRELTEFESNGLKDLAAGKDVVAVDATTNQIRMVGAIRMGNACMKCHDGKPGDLLGAFSYDLVRVPAYVAERK